MIEHWLKQMPLTGAYDDLFSLFARSENALKAGEDRRPPPSLTRLSIEVLFNLVGLLMGCAVRCLPPSIAIRIQDLLWRAVAKSTRYPFNPGIAELQEASRHSARVERETGRPAAILCLMSHPPVPDGLELNVEMSRHMLLGLYSLRKTARRPQLLLAMDHHALDMLDPISEGAYAGFMASCHLGLDRQAHLRDGASRRLLNVTSWERIAWRLARALAAGKGVGLALAGGVSQTARIVYATREFVVRLHQGRHASSKPSEVLSRLARHQPDFKSFLTDGPVGNNLRRNAWRMMEAWITARAVGQWPISSPCLDAAYTGRISPEIRDCLWNCAQAMGYDEKGFEASFESFAGEFARETPYRERFFRFLIRRVVDRGTPVILLPLTHIPVTNGKASKEEKPSWGGPMVLLRGDRNSVTIRSSQSGTEETLPIEDFAKNFVQTNFI